MGVRGSGGCRAGRVSRGTAALTVPAKVPSGALLRGPGGAFASSQQDLSLVFRLFLLPYGTVLTNEDAR